MAKQSVVNLDITVTGSDGYSIGGGGTQKRTLEVSGSDITLVGGPQANTLTISGSDITLIGTSPYGASLTISGSNDIVLIGSGSNILTMPSASALVAGTNIVQTFSQPQFWNSTATFLGATTASQGIHVEGGGTAAVGADIAGVAKFSGAVSASGGVAIHTLGLTSTSGINVRSSALVVSNSLSPGNIAANIYGMSASTGSFVFSGSTPVITALGVLGNAQVSGTLIVSGSPSTTTVAMAVMGMSASTGSFTFSGSLPNTTAFRTVGNAQVTGSMIVSGSDSVIGTSTVTGSMWVSGSLTVTGSFLMTGSATAWFNTPVYNFKPVSFSSSITHTGNTTQVGNVTLTGTNYVSGSLSQTEGISIGATGDSARLYWRSTEGDGDDNDQQTIWAMNNASGILRLFKGETSNVAIAYSSSFNTGGDFRMTINKKGAFNVWDATVDIGGTLKTSNTASLPSVSATGVTAATLRATNSATVVGPITVGGNINLTGNIVPAATDTVQIGSADLLVNKIWASELDTVLFAQNTITLLGGWFYVTKDQRTLPQPLASSDTSYTFDYTPTENDFIVLRQANKVEYIQIGASYGAPETRYLTRDLDGSGANDWPAGSPYAVLGYNGTGRIEMRALSGSYGPIISVKTQGTTYNSVTEHVRVGDLNGVGGITSETWGFWAGGGSNFIRATGDGNIYITGNITASAGNIGGWTTDNAKIYGLYGASYVGMQKPASDTTRVFFSSASDAIGTGARFYVTTVGQVITTDPSGTIMFDSNNQYLDAKNSYVEVYHDNTSSLSYAVGGGGTGTSGALGGGWFFANDKATKAWFVFNAWMRNTSANDEVTGRVLFGIAEEQVRNPYSASLEDAIDDTLTTVSSFQTSSTMGTGRKACFTADTQIWMYDGSTKPIRDIRSGEWVRSYDTSSGQFTTSSVDSLFVGSDTSYRVINGAISATAHHPFLTNNGWVEVKDLKVGDVLITRGAPNPIQYINDVTQSHEIPVYTLTMNSSSVPTFIANDYIVHNKPAASQPGFLAPGVIVVPIPTPNTWYRWAVKGEIQANPGGATATVKIKRMSVGIGRTLGAEQRLVTYTEDLLT